MIVHDYMYSREDFPEIYSGSGYGFGNVGSHLHSQIELHFIEDGEADFTIGGVRYHILPRGEKSPSEASPDASAHSNAKGVSDRAYEPTHEPRDTSVHGRINVESPQRGNSHGGHSETLLLEEKGLLFIFPYQIHSNRKTLAHHISAAFKPGRFPFFNGTLIANYPKCCFIPSSRLSAHYADLMRRIASLLDEPETPLREKLRVPAYRRGTFGDRACPARRRLRR